MKDKEKDDKNQIEATIDIQREIRIAKTDLEDNGCGFKLKYQRQIRFKHGWLC